MRALSRLRDGLVGAWCPSVSGWGGNVLRDLSGRNNHGTLTNMDPATDWVVSGGKQALDFDGVDDSVNIVQQSLPSAFSIMVWCNKRSNGIFNERILLGLTGSTTTYISVLTSSVDLAIGTAYTFNFPAISNNIWNCFVVTRNSNNLSRCFLNGIESSTGERTVANTYSFDKIGNYPIGSASHWDGQIDDVRIWNIALTPSEIRILSSERGIGLKPERTRRYVQGQTFTAARLRRQSLIGSGVY